MGEVPGELRELAERGGPRRVELSAAFRARLAKGGDAARAYAETLFVAVLEGGVTERRHELLLLARAARDGSRPAVAAVLELKRRFGSLTPAPEEAPAVAVPDPEAPRPGATAKRAAPERGSATGESAASPAAASPAARNPHGAKPAGRALPRIPAAARVAPEAERSSRLVRCVTLPWRRRRLLAALLLLAGFAHALLFPEPWLGRGNFLPEDGGGRPDALVAAFAARGYAVALDGEGAPLALAHARWPDRIPLLSGFLGRRVLVVAHRAGEPAEVVAARLVEREGALMIAAEPEPVSRTPEAAEIQLAPLPGAFAFMTDLGDGIVAVTAEAGDRSARAQFVFRKPLSHCTLRPAALDPALLEAVARDGRRTVRMLLNPSTGAAETAGIPFDFVPAGAGEEPFLPRLVDRVRSLPFVGNEPIAALEDFYYGWKDRAMRRLHGGGTAAVEPEKPAPADAEAPADAPETAAVSETADAPAAREDKAEGTPAAPVASPPSAGAAAASPVPAETAGLPDAAPAGSPLAGLRHISARLAPRLDEARGAFTAAAERARTARYAGPTSGPPPRWDGPALPPPLAPLLANPPRKGEGIWSDEGLPQPGDGPALFTTTWRPDPARPFAVMHLVSIDLARVDLHLVPGTEEPVSPKGLRGRGRVPEDAATRRRLVALFNGGFRTRHGKWGFIADGLPFVAPVPGMATVAVDATGRVRFGAYARSLDPAGPWRHLRQNLPPLLEGGRLNTRQKYWGAALNNSTHVWRSALGVTADGRRMVYGAGNGLSHATLARGMAAAGCDFAMQLDINDYHTYFHFLHMKEARGGAGELSARKLAEEMHSERRRGIAPYARDFFYITWKAAPAHLADE